MTFGNIFWILFILGLIIIAAHYLMKYYGIKNEMQNKSTQQNEGSFYNLSKPANPMHESQGKKSVGNKNETQAEKFSELSHQQVKALRDRKNT